MLSILSNSLKKWRNQIMAKLYVKKSDGTYVPQKLQSVTNIDVVQTTGNSVTATMSQDAVTKELASKQNTIADLETIKNNAQKGNDAVESINQMNTKLIYEHRTMVEAMVSLAARVDALEARQGLLGNATAGRLDVTELTTYLYPRVLYGHGVPSASVIPDNLPKGLPWDGVPVFIGQQYINLDATSAGLYYAKGHDSVSDWKQA